MSNHNNTVNNYDYRYLNYRSNLKIYKKTKPQRLVGSLIKQQAYADCVSPDYSINPNSNDKFINCHYWEHFDGTEKFFESIQSIYDEFEYDYYAR